MLREKEDGEDGRLLSQQVRRPGDANEEGLHQPTALGGVPSHKTTSGKKWGVQREEN